MPAEKKKGENNRLELIEAEEMVEKLSKDLDARASRRVRSDSRNRSSSSNRASRMETDIPDGDKDATRDRSNSSVRSVRLSRMDTSRKTDTRDRSDSSRRTSLAGNSRSNSRGDDSAVKASRSETNQSLPSHKPCLRKPSRSKSDTRVKEIAYSSLDDAKTKLREQASKAANKAGEHGRKAANLIGKAVEKVEESRSAARALKPLFDSDDESEAGAVGGAYSEEGRFDDDQWQMDEDPHGLGDLSGDFQRMILEDNESRIRKRSLEDKEDDESLHPRKIISPEPRPLSAISERRPDSCCPSDNEAFAEDIFDVVKQRDVKINWLKELCREKDAEIAKLKKEYSDLAAMIDERDEELGIWSAKEKENDKTIARLRKELSEAKTSLNDEKINCQAQQIQHEEEHDMHKAKYNEIWSKVTKLKEELSQSRKECEKLTDMLMTIRRERRREKEERQKVDDSHRSALNEMSKKIDSLKDENRRERRRRADAQSNSEEKYRKLKKNLLEKKEGYVKATTQDVKDVFAVDGSATDTDSDTDPEEEEEIRRINDRKTLKHHELKAMSDSYLVWPKYEECYDHSNFVDKCEKAAKRAIYRGLPKKYVATSLNVHIEKKVPGCREKFEILKGDDTADLPLKKTLELLRLSDPGHHVSGVEKFLNIMQAKREEEESFMKRVERRHDKHLIAASEAERIRAIKKQFYNGLIWKPPGLEAAMATCMDLEVVAQTTRQMIEDSRSQRTRNNTSEDSRYLRLPSTRPRFRPSVAAISDDEDEVFDELNDRARRERSASLPEKEEVATVKEPVDTKTLQTPERAETGREFKNDVVVCRKCRYIGQHYTNQCENKAYCSYCQKENGHTDENHVPPSQWQANRNQVQRNQGPRSHQQEQHQGNWQERPYNNQHSYRQRGNFQNRPNNQRRYNNYSSENNNNGANGRNNHPGRDGRFSDGSQNARSIDRKEQENHSEIHVVDDFRDNDEHTLGMDRNQH